MEVKTFKDLIVWQKSYTLVIEVYKATELFPSEEKYGLVPHVTTTTMMISASTTMVDEGGK